MSEQNQDFHFQIPHPDAEPTSMNIKQVKKKIVLNRVRMFLYLLLTVSLLVTAFGVVFRGEELTRVTSSLILFWMILTLFSHMLYSVAEQRLMKEAKFVYDFIEASGLDPEEAVAEYYEEKEKLLQQEEEEEED